MTRPIRAATDRESLALSFRRFTTAGARASLRAGVLALACLALAHTDAAAEDAPSPSLREAAAAAGEQLHQPRPGAVRRVVAPSRPSALVPLYVSFAALQVIDTHSTSRALAKGAVEANPLMKGIAASEVGLLAVKGAGTAGVLYVSEKMWKKNRAAAVIFMVAANSGMAWIVQNNYRAVR